MRRQRLYIEPHLHPFLSGLSYSNPSTLYPNHYGTVTFHCHLGGPRLSYLMDHIVLGRPLLPAAAMMELAAATAATLTADSAYDDGSLLAVQALTMSAPIIMSGPSAAEWEDGVGLEVVCSLDLMTGQLQIGYVQDGDNGSSMEQMVVCATATAGIVAAKGVHGAEQQSWQKMQAATAALLSDVLSLHVAAAVKTSSTPAATADSGSTAAAAVGTIQSVSADWHASGYFSSPRQVDSALHLGVVQPGSGAKVPVAAGSFLVPAAAARRAATGRLIASASPDSLSQAMAATGMSSASYLITADSSAAAAAASGSSSSNRVPGRNSGIAAGAGELVMMVEGLQTKVPRQADMIRRPKAARTAQQPATSPTAAGASAEGAEEGYPCSYEIDWQLSEPGDAKVAASAASGARDTPRHTGKLTVVLAETTTEATGAAGATAASLQLELKTASPAAAAANTLAVLQQVNQLQAAVTAEAASASATVAVTAAYTVQAQVPGSNSKLGPADGLRGSPDCDADAASAVWGLLRTEATEQTSIAVSLVDSDSQQPGEQQQKQQLGTAAALHPPGAIQASAVRAAGVHVPRLLPVAKPEGAEHLVIQPEPRSSLSNLVARAADLCQVRRSLISTMFPLGQINRPYHMV